MLYCSVVESICTCIKARLALGHFATNVLQPPVTFNRQRKSLANFRLIRQENTHTHSLHAKHERQRQDNSSWHAAGMQLSGAGMPALWQLS